jgi:hypothetical protein
MPYRGTGVYYKASPQISHTYLHTLHHAEVQKKKKTGGKRKQSLERFTANTTCAAAAVKKSQNPVKITHSNVKNSQSVTPVTKRQTHPTGPTRHMMPVIMLLG